MFSLRVVIHVTLFTHSLCSGTTLTPLNSAYWKLLNFLLHGITFLGNPGTMISFTTHLDSPPRQWVLSRFHQKLLRNSQRNEFKVAWSQNAPDSDHWNTWPLSITSHASGFNGGETGAHATLRCRTGCIIFSDITVSTVKPKQVVV